MGRFAGQSVLVTGASRGLGRAIAHAFGREGARVGIGYRTRREDAEQTLGLVRAAGGDGILLAMDVREPSTITSAVEGFSSESGLDVLVNSAAMVRDNLFPMMSVEDWDHVTSVNLNGIFHCCRAVVKGMIARRRGAIVNVASVAGFRASPGQANYAASKGGVISMTATLAVELARFRIRVNAVVPGLLSTGMGERLDRRIVERRRAEIPLARLGDGAEVARAVLFLASEDASYIVGHCLVVDGGMSL